MKKKKWIIGLAVVVLLLGMGAVAAHEFIHPKSDAFLDASKKAKPGQPRTVIATVNGEEISQEILDLFVINEEIIRENTGNKNPVDQKEILNELIRNTVSFQEAVRLGLEADYEAARAEIEESYRIAMEQTNSGSDFLREYIEKMEMTEAEYLEAAGKVRQGSLTRVNLYRHYTEGMQGTDEEKKAAYEAYVDELVAKADIQMVSK